MRKLALSMAGAGTFAVLALGLAGPAMATPIAPTHDPAYSTDSYPTTLSPAECSVIVNYQGANVDVRWC